MGNHSTKSHTSEENKEDGSVTEKQEGANMEDEQQEIPPSDVQTTTLAQPQPPVILQPVEGTYQTGDKTSVGSTVRHLPVFEHATFCYDMALSDGRLYLSDFSRHVVDIVDAASHARVTRWGSFNEQGQAVVGQPPLFYHPWGVAVDEPRGRVYVADYSNHCVVVVRICDGLVEAVWSNEEGTDQQELIYPLGLAYCPTTDLLYVSDGNNHCVKVLRCADGLCVQVLGTGRGNGNNQMSSPHSVAVDSDRIYIADYSNHRVVVYAKQTGAFMFQMGQGEGSGNTNFYYPNSVSVDSETGVVYVADRNNHRVCVYRSDGSYVRHFQVLRANNNKAQPAAVMWDGAASVLYASLEDSNVMCVYPS